ncbi:hypothetical protein BJV74DRAFT_889341 [Russula compacta]|nr:hypothetical protein BJV74DRAFT_889341 [Russula compacta]
MSKTNQELQVNIDVANDLAVTSLQVNAKFESLKRQILDRTCRPETDHGDVIAQWKLISEIWPHQPPSNHLHALIGVRDTIPAKGSLIAPSRMGDPRQIVASQSNCITAAFAKFLQAVRDDTVKIDLKPEDYSATYSLFHSSAELYRDKEARSEAIRVY